MMKPLFTFLLLCALTLPVQAMKIKIAAVVNDTVISTLDVAQRARLLGTATPQTDDPAQLQQMLVREALKQLIDESLKRQEAGRFSISVSRDEISQGIAKLEAMRGMSAGALPERMREAGVTEAALHQQVESQLMWNKFIARRLQREVNITDEELLAARRRIANDAGMNNNAEVVIKQLSLALASDAEFEEVDVLMDIAREVAKYPGSCQESGIAGFNDFEGLNINVDFVRTTYSNMSPQVRPLVESLGVTDISEPFATPQGIRLLMLCERINLPPALPPEDQVRGLLAQEKLELEAEKHLRNIRREAFIDVKV